MLILCVFVTRPEHVVCGAVVAVLWTLIEPVGAVTRPVTQAGGADTHLLISHQALEQTLPTTIFAVFCHLVIIVIAMGYAIAQVVS